VSTRGRRTFHMLPAEDWQASKSIGRVEPASLAAEGFVHCTDTAEELARVGDRYYAADPRPYVAVTVDLERVGAPWRYDDVARVYPHVYGPIPLAAVVRVSALPRDAIGHFLAPLEANVNSLEPLLDRLSAAGARLASTRPTVESGVPWPVGAVAAGGGEAEWGPTEALAHVSEFLPYWLGEMERVIAGTDGHGAGGPTPFGRTAADPVRSLTVVRDSTLPPRELYDRIAGVLQRYRWRIPELTDEEIGRRGVHSLRGELAVPQLIERFAVSHLEEHAEQLEATLRR
jgi:uncharacterized protein (DUF952 family)